MTDSLRRRWWRIAAFDVLLVWFAAVLWLNGPGHLSVDSLVQLHESRSGVIESYNPVFATVLFGVLDALGGPRLLVVSSSLMLFAGLMALLPSAQRPRFAGVPILALFLAGPILLIYPAIVWKDVWFAHFALLGFAVIALRRHLPWAVVEAGSLLTFAAALLTRPNGFPVVVVGAAALALARWYDDAPRHGLRERPMALIAGIGARLAALLVLGVALSWGVRVGMQQVDAREIWTGARLLLHYDIAGMIAQNPARKLSVLAERGIDVDRLKEASRSSYSDERIDTLSKDVYLPVSSAPDAIVAAQWLALVSADPAGYLAHRAAVFSWLLGLRNQERCLPVHLGFADAARVEKAGVSATPTPHLQLLFDYTQHFVNTPYFSPGAWALTSAVTLVFALVQRRLDPAMIGMQIAALAYLASYFFLSIACDFRYSYFSVLAATIGIVWLAAVGLRRKNAAG